MSTFKIPAPPAGMFTPAQQKVIDISRAQRARYGATAVGDEPHQHDWKLIHGTSGTSVCRCGLRFG